MSETKNIYQRINSVMKAVTYVQKDAVVQGYKAVTHDNVTAVLRPELVKEGIVIEVAQKKSKIIKEWQSKSGTNFHRYSGNYVVSFVNIDNPQDRVIVPINALADDNADKAPGKAASYAVKYAMLKTFSLETGENEEGRYGEAYSDQQLEIFHELLEGEKAYEFYMFMSTLPIETQGALNSSFPDGKKSNGKKAVKELFAKGHDEFTSVVSTVKQRLADQDISVIEITEEMTPIEKRLLASRLTDFEVAQLKKIKEASA